MRVYETTSNFSYKDKVESRYAGYTYTNVATDVKEAIANTETKINRDFDHVSSLDIEECSLICHIDGE